MLFLYSLDIFEKVIDKIVRYFIFIVQRIRARNRKCVEQELNFSYYSSLSLIPSNCRGIVCLMENKSLFVNKMLVFVAS